MFSGRFSSFRTDVWDDFLWETLKQVILRHAQIHDRLCRSVLWGKKGEKIAMIEQKVAKYFYKIFDWIVCFVLWAVIKADKLLPSSKSDSFQCHNHNRCDYFCSAIGINYFPMVLRYKIIVNYVFRWLSIIGPAMRLYRCIAEV